MDPSAFYTGLVADLYRPLRSEVPDPEPYARFVARSGGPALELGCGDGDPLLALRARGLEVEGVDSSADMLDRCRARAAAEGLDVVLHHQSMEHLDLGSKRFSSAYLAGATFCLLPDDTTAEMALECVAAHVIPGGRFLVPLFVPEQSDAPEIRLRELRMEDGTILRVGAVAVERDETTRTQTTVLRYERQRGDELEVLERPWIVHWYGRDHFSELAAAAGWSVQRAGEPGSDAVGPFVLVREG
jgi:SAM-dependent methyltransferase